MNSEIILKLIENSPSIAVLIIVIFILWKYMSKQINDRIRYMEKDIDGLKSENKADKELFRQAICSFEISVKEFKSIRYDLNDIKSNVKKIDKDLMHIRMKTSGE